MYGDVVSLHVCVSQCEQCLCWQHGDCIGVSKVSLPEKYLCCFCTNPPGQGGCTNIHIHVYTGLHVGVGGGGGHNMKFRAFGGGNHV